MMDRLGPSFRLDPRASFETVTGRVRNTAHLAEGPFEMELFRIGTIRTTGSDSDAGSA